MLGLALLANYLGIPALAIAFALWARARALAPRAGDRSTAWFPFLRRVHTVSSLAISGSLLVNIWALVGGAFGRATGLSWTTIGVAEGWTFVFLPALVIQGATTTLAHGVSRALDTTELTWPEARRQVAWASATYLCATLGATGAMVSAAHFADGGVRAFGLWLVVAVVGTTICNRRFQAELGVTPHALTHGALRDRLFELAGRAGVRLRQLYVLPMRRLQMANAFAVENEMVLVTDLLLERLDRDEVDAIMAHEIAHLRHKHPTKLGVARIAPLAIAVPVGMAGFWIPALLLAAAGTIASNALSRAFERTADREVPRLGASGEALVTGLVKLAKLNHLPLAWSRGSGWLLTHPSIVQRAERMARDLGLSPERVAEMLAWTPPKAERYPIEAAAATVDRLFTTPFKHGMLLRNAAALLAVAAFVPALIARLALPFAPSDRGWAWLAALVLAPAACVLVLDLVSAGPLRAMRERLRSRLFPPRAAADSGADAAMLCGLAPHAEARVYEGFSNWDLGFASVERGRLRYRGEEADFALTPGQVVAVELAAGAPNWLATRVVRIRWRDEAGEERAFRLAPLESRRLSAMGTHARVLHERLERWRRADVAPATRDPGDAATPDPGDASPPTRAITSLWPRELATPKTYLRLPTFALLAGAVACCVVGAPFWPPRGMGFFEVVATCAFTQAFLMIPLSRDRGHLTAQSESEPNRRAA